MRHNKLILNGTENNTGDGDVVYKLYRESLDVTGENGIAVVLGAGIYNYTYNTTPSGSWFGWSFPNQGDGSTYLVNDTTNYRFYRVTLMIGPGYLKNFISIERLY